MSEITSFPINTVVFNDLEVITDAQATDADGVLFFDESVGVMKRMTRGELFKGKVIPINSIADFAAIDVDELSNRQQFHLNSFAPTGSSGGGPLLWAPDKPKSLHDGVRYFSPTVPIPADFDNPTDVQNYMDGIGEEFPTANGIFELTLYSIQSSEFPAVDGAFVLWDGVSGNQVKNGVVPSTIGVNALQIPNITEVSYSRYNADETISMRTLTEHKADLLLNNVDNTSDANKPISTANQAALDLKANSSDVTAALALKAPLASPALTGNPTAPTPTTGDNDTSIATTAFVQNELAIGYLTPEKYGCIGNGIALDTVNFQATVTAAIAQNKPIFANGDYLTDANISNLHDVKFIGKGSIVRGSNTWVLSPDRSDTRVMHVSPSGLSSNDGLGTATPMTIQGAVDALSKNGPIKGRQQIVGIAGTYDEKVSIPIGLAINENYLEFKFPSSPGVRTDPGSWPVGGARLNGTNFDGVSGAGFIVGSYNNVYIEYLLIEDWYDTALSSTSQVKQGLVVSRFANCFTYGCSYLGNGWSNLAVLPGGSAIVTGGVIDGARYCIDNTGGRLSLTANASTYTEVNNGLEYGLYAKHDSSSVLDYTRFDNCGQVAPAAAYGAALFAYKSNASIDTRACEFTNNNIVYNMRGGSISTSPDLPDVIGSGNDRVWLTNGFGSDDLINYRSIAARELSLSFGGNSIATTGTPTLIFDTNATIPVGYLLNINQYIEIEIFGSNNGAGVAAVRPSFVSPGGTRYELRNFVVPASTGYSIKLIVQAQAGGTAVNVTWTAVGATFGGAASGTATSIAAPFATEVLEYQTWGETAATTLSVNKSRVILWG